jgi:formylglycine-generating enzyme required for sulfatase activity
MTNAGTGYVSAPAVIISLPPKSLGVGLTLSPTVRVRGEPGTVALIQWASSVGNTNHWTTITSVVLGADSFIWCDTDGVQPGQRFYRAIDQSTIPVPANMALVPASDFTMGDSFEEVAGSLPLHTVTVSAFFVDKYEVTKAVWDGVHIWATTNGYSFEVGGKGKAPDHPAQSMTWYDAVKWCNARSQKEGKTPAYYTDAAMTMVYKSGNVDPYVRWDRGYRLPTEAEWEKAARGGASGLRFPWGNTITHSQANYYSSSGLEYDQSPTRSYHPTYNDGVFPFTSPVGTFLTNAYGLYDMSGNVWEWCWDWPAGYGSEAQTDPRGATSGAFRAFRGGGWDNNALCCRVAYRSWYNPAYGDHFIGFRCVLPPSQP